MDSAISVVGLNKHFANNKHVLKDINIDIKQGEMVALIGASGSGKSTLMRHMAGLVTADKNSRSVITINGEEVQRAGKLSARIRHIRGSIGVIFQQFNLIDRLSVLNNVMVGQFQFIHPLRSHLGIFRGSEKIKALKALGRVGILQCHTQRASTLSGGQQQRAAIARTLVQEAKVILADEPIASLDPESSRNVMDILARINRDDRVTVVVTLHQIDVAIRHCHRVIALREGAVVFDGLTTELTAQRLTELFGMSNLHSFDEHLPALVADVSSPTKPFMRPERMVA